MPDHKLRTFKSFITPDASNLKDYLTASLEGTSQIIFLMFSRKASDNYVTIKWVLSCSCGIWDKVLTWPQKMDTLSCFVQLGLTKADTFKSNLVLFY
jgi:hypothetical protein